MIGAGKQDLLAGQLSTDEEAPLACDMSALDQAERSRHGQLVQEILSSAGRMSETETGYRRVFEDEAMLPSVAEWIALEHRCCPFLTLSLSLDPRHLALELSGPNGVKEFLRAELGM